jgi:hypothetical protein
MYIDYYSSSGALLPTAISRHCMHSKSPNVSVSGDWSPFFPLLPFKPSLVVTPRVDKASSKDYNEIVQATVLKVKKLT